MAFLKFITLAASLVATSAALSSPSRSLQLSTRQLQARQSESQVQSAYFEQWIDHNNTSLGTFQQFYYYSTEYWGGEGSPVIVYTPGERAVYGDEWFLSDASTVGVLAKNISAAMIMLEHRYWGNSSPYPELTAETLQYMTVENAMSDFTNFAKTVTPPFDSQRESSYDKTPWVLMAGSYPGALTAWIAAKQPDVYWAYYSSSAPVQAIEDFWEYYTPAQDFMPQNCSTDLVKVIDYVDDILINGTSQQQADLKAQFGLQGVSDNADFATVLANGPQLWQNTQLYGNNTFQDFCDAIENTSGGSLAGADGVGLDNALANYAQWIMDNYPCSYQGCYDTQEASDDTYTNTTVGNDYEYRQWEWLLCNQPLGWWQIGAPAGENSIVSRLVTGDYYRSRCVKYFPETDGYSLGDGTVDEFNEYTGGWNIMHPRLLYVENEKDVWTSAGVRSQYRPGGPMQSTSDQAVIVVPGGYHMSDMITENGELSSDIQEAIDAAVLQISTFVGQFYS